MDTDPDETPRDDGEQTEQPAGDTAPNQPPDGARTENHEGAPGYDPASAHEKLVRCTSAQLLEASFYDSQHDAVLDVRNAFALVADTAPEHGRDLRERQTGYIGTKHDTDFPVKLAAELRQETGLRDVAVFLLVLAAHDDRTKRHVRAFAPDVLDRADDITTAVAISHALSHDAAKPGHAIVRAVADGLAPANPPTTALPKPLENAIRDAIGELDAYEVRKYGTRSTANAVARERAQRMGHAVTGKTLRDVFNLVHPTPTAEQETVFEQLMTGDLSDRDTASIDPPATWEHLLSNAPQIQHTEAFETIGNVTETSDTRKREVVGDLAAFDPATLPASIDASELPNADQPTNGRPQIDLSLRCQTKRGETRPEVEVRVRYNQPNLSVAEANALDASVTLTPVVMQADGTRTRDRANEWSEPIETVLGTTSRTVTPPRKRFADRNIDALDITVRTRNERYGWQAALPRMGLFAILRNLRNMLDAGVAEADILAQLDMGGAVDSKLLPFRFYQAYAALDDAGYLDAVDGRASGLAGWLSEVIEATVENVPDFLGDTLVAIDLSGSMESPISERSVLHRNEIAAFFGVLCATKGADVGAFGTRYFNFGHEIAEAGTPLESTREVLETSGIVGDATNGWLALDHAREFDLDYERVILFTDEQIWDSRRTVDPTGPRSNRLDAPPAGFDTYTGPSANARETELQGRTVGDALTEYRVDEHASTSLYMVNLANYGTRAMPPDVEGVHSLNGWSPNMIEYIRSAEDVTDTIDRVADRTPPAPGTPASNEESP